MSQKRSRTVIALLIGLAIGSSRGATAQHFPTNDPVIERIWEEGMTDRSQAGALAQALMDSIGPRLTASRGHEAAIDWLLSLYQRWSVPARKRNTGRGSAGGGSTPTSI